MAGGKELNVLALLSVTLLAIEFRNSGAQYVGSKACMPCHKAVYDKFIKTAMGRSMTRPDARMLAAPVRVANPKSQRDYQVLREGADLFQADAGLGLQHKLEYAIGSGANGISFAIRRGNHLFQAPLSYYAAAKRWDLSPGYEETGEGFNRPIFEDCIVCHSGRPQAVPKRDGLFREPPFTELAIGCENCHGPGELHVKERSHALKATVPDTSIVNPHHLPSRVTEDICMQCHQGGDTRVLLPGKSYRDFRPGQRLIDTVAIFSLEGKSADLLEHHASMKLSACFRGSQGKLGCVTCHDPHDEPAAPAAFFRAKCLSCHTESSCTARGSDANCIACHMPKRSVEKISHSALTNHRIPARPSEHYTAPSGLLSVNGDEAKLPLVTRLQGYGGLAGRDPAIQQKYTDLLGEAARTNKEDPVVLAALGHQALQNSSFANASTFLVKAEEKGATGPIFFLDLAEALSQAGRVEDSTAALERGEALFPWSPALRKRLVLGYIRQKTYTKAKAAMERYVADFPEDEFMQRLLKQAPQ